MDSEIDPIGAALRAEAEVARAEIRAEGIVCPSCCTNMADLPEGHSLVISGESSTAKCGDGVTADLGDNFAKLQAAANIALYDDFRRREAEAFSRILGS